MSEAVGRGELADEHGAEGQAAGGLQAAGRDLGVTAEDGLELLVGYRAEPVEVAATVITRWSL
jgi:hypothetical protein